MPTHDHGREDARRKAAPAPVRRTAPPRHVPGLTSAQQITALQSSAGNAAVVQMLRQEGLLQEPHRHGAGCGHEQSGQDDRAERPAVQRSAVHDVLRRSGKPLDASVRTDMESRLGADFSDVRVHDDAAAKASAAEVGARAYTSGSHVVLGDGGDDRHTLAHELTHVIQQRQGPVSGTDNGQGLKVSDPSDRFEREAEANAHRALSGPAPTADATEPVQRTAAPAYGAEPQAVQRAGEQSEEDPAPTPEARQAEAVRHFTDFFHAHDECRDFNTLYYQYLDQKDLPPRIANATEKQMAKVRTFLSGLWEKLDAKRNAYETTGHPMEVPTGPRPDIRIYRKMATAEAAAFLGGQSHSKGFEKAMDHDKGEKYRKYFTTSLEHSATFENQNAETSEGVKVLEFTIRWPKYWEFYQEFGKPNQQKGTFDDPNSAPVHQEKLIKGQGANFRAQRQVDEVYDGKTHHNIGIGHGNQADFRKLITGVREVPQKELTQAVAAARTAMKEAINAQMAAEAQAQGQVG